MEEISQGEKEVAKYLAKMFQEAGVSREVAILMIPPLVDWFVNKYKDYDIKNSEA